MPDFRRQIAALLGLAVDVGHRDALVRIAHPHDRRIIRCVTVEPRVDQFARRPRLGGRRAVDRRARRGAAEHVVVKDARLLGGDAVGEDLHTMGLTPAGIDVAVGEDDLCDRDRRVAPATVGERRVDNRHFQRRHAEGQPAERFGRVARQMGGNPHLVGHLRDRLLAEVGRELGVDGVVGRERRVHEAERLVQRGALEGFYFVIRFGRQPPRLERVGQVVGGVRVDPTR